ncbi:Rho/RAC guanine nucleotide exchange factor, putative [Entamoeba invadens IP1]|uniref:Rho/RAC guanine nucleotide exchange factor, putative n=1 Tax=Entamoeba invadens IP1 TaxID=370355 RepID=UPI0002C3F802|nr:Rho/RAC guanine nucleotide exchange factor, putative [Entamoeba invadens IP1]ELP94209.1 Rho/RAC guanine nucleotide exchange factor, putative [Entamoeba invadens IP1]|eukprot:XP_004260980.1 Rho/RAC guanine nucleotide exchange factor, putative [Entamoeba invadens IP1]
MSSRDKVINEIFQTEVTYSNSLSELRTYYYDDMKQRSDKVIPISIVNDIFEGFEDALAVSQYFISTLRKYKQSNTLNSNIQDVFLEMAPLLVFIRDFVGNNQRAISIVNKLIQDQKVSNYLEQIRQGLPTTPKQDLSSLLIMPVQRTPRYVLLIQEVLKHTSKEEHPDWYSGLEKAVEAIKGVASYVNCYIPEYQRISQLNRIAKYLPKSLQENWLSKNRTVVVLNMSLMYGEVVSITNDMVVVGKHVEGCLVPFKVILIVTIKHINEVSGVVSICTKDDCETKLAFQQFAQAKEFCETLENVRKSSTIELVHQLQQKICWFCHTHEDVIECGDCHKPMCFKCLEGKCKFCELGMIKIESNKNFAHLVRPPIVLLSDKQLKRSMNSKQEMADYYEQFDFEDKKEVGNAFKKSDWYLSMLQGNIHQFAQPQQNVAQPLDTGFYSPFARNVEENVEEQKKVQSQNVISPNPTVVNNPFFSDSKFAMPIEPPKTNGGFFNPFAPDYVPPTQ